jgi:hypothetical protein
MSWNSVCDGSRAQNLVPKQTMGAGEGGRVASDSSRTRPLCHHAWSRKLPAFSALHEGRIASDRFCELGSSVSGWWRNNSMVGFWDQSFNVSSIIPSLSLPLRLYFVMLACRLCASVCVCVCVCCTFAHTYTHTHTHTRVRRGSDACMHVLM